MAPKCRFLILIFLFLAENIFYCKMSGFKSKATRLSVSDFDNCDNLSSHGNDIIYMKGCEFPKAFTYNNPGMLDGIAFCICLKGNVTIKVNSKIYNINHSMAIVIMPNHIVEPIERSENLEMNLLVISLKYFADINLDVEAVKRLELNPCIDISDVDKEILADMFLTVKKLCDSNLNRCNNKVLFGMIETIVLKLESLVFNSPAQSQSAKVSRPEEITQQFLKMVITSYKEARTIDMYANELCVSPKYLTQVVRQTTGETPFEWMNKIVMIGAKNLIRTKNISIIQVSEELNFPNPSFFGRFFKKHSGMTPLEFRRST